MSYGVCPSYTASLSLCAGQTPFNASRRRDLTIENALFKYNEKQTDRSGFVRKQGAMELKRIEHKLSVCKVADTVDFDLTADFYFIGKTDEELSLVCKTEDVPHTALERDDGWRGFRVRGTLDFSLIGVLSKLTGILAENEISVFAVSTFNTDYILVKE